MPVGRNHGLNNQEGRNWLTPQTSLYGQLLAIGTHNLIAQPRPIGFQDTGAFKGTVGGMATRSASVIPLAHPGGYFGDVPLDQQDFVDAPPPWKRP